jgi:hypothetical protein
MRRRIFGKIAKNSAILYSCNKAQDRKEFFLIGMRFSREICSLVSHYPLRLRRPWAERGVGSEFRRRLPYCHSQIGLGWLVKSGHETNDYLSILYF